MANGMSHLTNGHHMERKTIFKPVSKTVARNFMVTDTIFISPSISGVGIPGPDSAMYDMNPNGLPDANPEIIAELPEDCRNALLQAKREEDEWKHTWGSETTDGMRGRLKIGFMGYPV